MSSKHTFDENKNIQVPEEVLNTYCAPHGLSIFKCVLWR